jgi:hypothetical protein
MDMELSDGWTSMTNKNSGPNPNAPLGVPDVLAINVAGATAPT